MSASQLPQQRVFAVADLGERPEPFDSVVGYGEQPSSVELPNGPLKPRYLGQVEWAWSPANARVDAYYLHKGRHYWMLWIRSYDDNWEEWNWSPVGYVPRRQASRREAAVHLLIDFWRFEKAQHHREHYHWINETDELGTSDFRTIGMLVWPEDTERLRVST